MKRTFLYHSQILINMMSKAFLVWPVITLNFNRWCIFTIVFVMGITYSFLSVSQPNPDNNWTQFRGNNRSGKSMEKNLLDKWPEKGPEQIWKMETGQGFSEVVVSGNVAYLMACDTTDEAYEYITALDIGNGEELWQTKIDSMFYEVDGWGHGPRSTPAIDDRYIYCLSGYGKLAAYSIQSGKEIWATNMIIDYGSTLPRWGYSTSPILIDGILIIETGGNESGAFAAIDKNTGMKIWSKGTGAASYNSPAVAIIDNKVHIVFANDTMLYSFDKKGNENWSYRMPIQAPTAMPVFIPPNRFFVSTVGRTGSFIVQVEGNDVKEVLTSRTMQNYFGSSCYHNGYLYGFSRAKLQCISAETGKLHWAQRGFGAGSLILVNDKLLVLSDQGLLTLVAASPEGYKAHGTVQALDGKSWTAPSFANGNVFLRNLSQVSCYKLIN